MATSLGEYFKELRKKINVSQEEMAKFLSLEQSSISRFENGTGNPSLRTLKRLAEGLGMSLKVEFVPKKPTA